MVCWRPEFCSKEVETGIIESVSRLMMFERARDRFKSKMFSSSSSCEDESSLNAISFSTGFVLKPSDIFEFDSSKPFSFSFGVFTLRFPVYFFVSNWSSCSTF